MQVKLDDEVLFEIDDRMVKILAYDLLDPMDEIKRRLRWIIEHKCDCCFSRMQEEYKELLTNDNNIKSFPKSKQEMADLIMSRPYYKDRVTKEKSME